MVSGFRLIPSIIITRSSPGAAASGCGGFGTGYSREAVALMMGVARVPVVMLALPLEGSSGRSG